MCRKLERERDDLLAILGARKADIDRLKEDVNRIERDRDAWKAKAENWKQAGLALAPFALAYSTHPLRSQDDNLTEALLQFDMVRECRGRIVKEEE